MSKPKPYIDVAGGRAKYSHTEVENAYGRWNDNWWSIRGEYVVHEGNKHHVYILER